MPVDNQNELFYWVDENDFVLGTITRRQAHSGSRKIHRAVSVLVTNKKKEILLQHRSHQKDTNPGMWAESVGGHVTYKDSYYQTAVRETQEELGISVKPRFIAKGLFDLKIEREFFYIYQASYQTLPSQFDRDEIDQVRWVSISALPAFIKKYPCTLSCQAALKTAGFIPES
jgi:isopentenyl-diphosphate delta-isomerase type 1